MREDQYYAEMVCTCARRFLECEGDRSNFLLFALTLRENCEDVEWVVEVNQAVENSDFAPYYFQYRLFKRVSESMSLREIATLPTSAGAYSGGLRLVRRSRGRGRVHEHVRKAEESRLPVPYLSYPPQAHAGRGFLVSPSSHEYPQALFGYRKAEDVYRTTGVVSASLTHRHTAREKRSRVWPCPEIQSACGKNIHRTCCKRYARNRRLSAASQDIWN